MFRYNEMILEKEIECVCIYIYIYIYTHTHIYIYVCTYIYISKNQVVHIKYIILFVNYTSLKWREKECNFVLNVKINKNLCVNWYGLKKQNFQEVQEKMLK